MSDRNRLGQWMLLVFCLAMLVGCGDGRARRVPVSGTVTVDGKPLVFGSITFFPKSGQTSETRACGGSFDENGAFKISSFTPNDGLMPGNYEVMVLAIEPISETSQRWHAPKKYAAIATSGLSFEVTEKVDNVNFDLSWEGEDPAEPFVE